MKSSTNFLRLCKPCLQRLLFGACAFLAPLGMPPSQLILHLLLLVFAHTLSPSLPLSLSPLLPFPLSTHRSVLLLLSRFSLSCLFFFFFVLFRVERMALREVCTCEWRERDHQLELASAAAGVACITDPQTGVTRSLFWSVCFQP